MRTLNRIARHLRSTDGAEIAEVALVLPLVFMFLLGIVWFGRAFNIYSTIQQAAQQGAIAAARSTCATCENKPTPIGNVGGPVGSVAFTIAGVLQASNLDPSQILATSLSTPVLCTNPPGTCTVTGNITVCTRVLLNPSAGLQPPLCGALVSFRYPAGFSLPFTSLTQINLAATAQSRMEN